MVEMGPNVGWKWGNRVQPSGSFGELLGDTASGCHHSWTFLDHHFATPRSKRAMC